jgi:uncharacterized paraquat-inducible protein A
MTTRGVTASATEMSGVWQYLKENPQALVLLVITVVLGIGTFVIVIVALASSGSTTTDGEPSDWIQLLHTAAATLPF